MPPIFLLNSTGNLKEYNLTICVVEKFLQICNIGKFLLIFIMSQINCKFTFKHAKKVIFKIIRRHRENIMANTYLGMHSYLNYLRLICVRTYLQDLDAMAWRQR